MSEISTWQILLIAAVGYYLVRPLVSGYLNGSKREDAKTKKSKHQKAPNPATKSAHSWPSLGRYEFEVVGESNYQSALSDLAGDHGTEAAEVECQASLAPEDDNSFDDMAVAVYVLESTVGYLARDEARSFRRRLAKVGLSGQVTTCGALVVGGWTDRSGTKMHYGVKLDIKPFE